MSLRGKILLLAGFMTLVTATVGLVSFGFSTRTVAAFEEVVKDDVPAIRALNRMLLSFRMARIEVLQLIAPETGPEQAAASVKIIKEQWAAFDDNQKMYLDHTLTDEEKTLFKETKDSFDVERQDFAKVLDLYGRGVTGNPSAQKEMARIVFHDIAQHGLAVRDTTKKMIDFQASAIEEDSQRAFGAALIGNRISLAVTLLGSLAGFLIAFFFSNGLASKLNAIVGAIAESCDQVDRSASDIASSSQELSQAAVEQAAALQETTSSLEQISAMIAKSAESAKTTDESSVASQQKAEQGQGVVNHMSASMTDISDSNDAIMGQITQSNQKMVEIVQLIQEIGNKTKVINDIVFQTKLLSFNASVEAARAGEHGKGFAVVAEEVGNLAQMSGNASREISEMLTNSISRVESIAQETKSRVESLIKEDKHKIESGVGVAHQCSDILGEIVQNVAKVTGLSQEISQASKEQALGVGEISKAMAQLDAVTQQNTEVSQNSATASEALAAQSKALKSAIGDLVRTVTGKGEVAPEIAPGHFTGSRAESTAPHRRAA